MSRTSSWPGGCRPAEAAWTLVPCRPASAPVVWGERTGRRRGVEVAELPEAGFGGVGGPEMTPRERLRASRRRAERAGRVLEQLRDPVRRGRSVPYERFHELVQNQGDVTAPIKWSARGRDRKRRARRPSRQCRSPGLVLPRTY